MATVPRPALSLTVAELQAVTAYAVDCASPALAIFERDRPGDGRPRAAITAAASFAAGGRRTKALRDAAWAALRAAQEARDSRRRAAGEAARAAAAACGAAFLHPLPKATQVRHILGAAAHAARAFELDAGDDSAVGDAEIARSRSAASAAVIDVLRRYPAAPEGGGRVGEWLRHLDQALRMSAPPE